MALSIAGMARVVHAGQGYRAFSSIPVKHIARVARFPNVKDEATAMKLDAIVAEAVAEIKKMPGYVKTTRTVCKAEWAYEIEYVFEGGDNFKAYMESDWRKEATEKMPDMLKDLGISMDDLYMGNRVYDEYTE
eukprot:gnl/TRDRNA2_/TRDRNA2_135935_c0_seq1.p1 gnl/TRDRNA2_/TRDRNA2_135935_c0~~gnl/TRDRNA2_/TRDRNA2_135935_c0_seq1.p1  ORF type:complete len:133 (+),score=37.60 gnl/TRDRNA2_/TRDRNA2_135935_c0_seq1:95-493(+)